MSTDIKFAPLTQKWLDRMIAKSPPNRFWDHLSFCATLFWALRRMKQLRAGQLLGAVLAKHYRDGSMVGDEAELAFWMFDQERKKTGDERLAFKKQITPTLIGAERTHALSRTEDDHLANLIEEYVHEHP